MAFLTLNGITIPVTDCDLDWVEVGQRGRSVSGSYLLQRTALKRRWNIRTKPITFTDAMLIQSLILGRHDIWRFDSTTKPQSTSTTDIASVKGRAVTNTPVFNVETDTAADGKPVVILGSLSSETLFYAPAKYSPGGGIIMAPTTTNLATAEMSNLEAGITGWSALGGGVSSVAQDATRYWQGTKSLKITITGSASGGAITNYIVEGAGPPYNDMNGRSYTFSTYIYAETAGRVVFDFLVDASNTVSSAAVLEAGKWTRVWVTYAVATNPTNGIRLRIQKDFSGAANYYVDGFQCERIARPTPWVVGGSTRAAVSSPTYAAATMNTLSDWTISLWSRGAGQPSRGVFGIRESSAVNSIQANHDGSSKFTITVLDSLGASSSIAEAAAVSSGAWTHYAITYASASKLLTLYKNGSSAGTATLSNALSLASVGALTIGDTSGASTPMERHLDDFAIFPYAIPAAGISTIYGSTSALATPTAITATGDMTNNESVTVIGVAPKATYMRLFNPTYQNNTQSVTFTLEEI